MSTPSPPPGFSTSKTMPSLPQPPNPDDDALGNINRTTSFANLAAVVGEGKAVYYPSKFTAVLRAEGSSEVPLTPPHPPPTPLPQA